MKILMLAATSGLAEQLAALEPADYDVETVSTLREVLDRAERCSYRIIAIDLDEVAAAPAEVVASVRTVSSAPLLLARRFVDDIDQIVALEAGADGIASKPLTARLLLAHLRSIGRSREQAVAPIQRPSEFGALRVDPSRQIAAWGMTRIDVRGVEIDILNLLAAAKGRPISRDTLLECLGRGPGCWRALNTSVSRLRKRLQAQGLEQIRICAVSRYGYRLSLCESEPGFVVRAARPRAFAPQRSSVAEQAAIGVTRAV